MINRFNVEKRHTAYIQCSIGIQYMGKHAERLHQADFRKRILERIEWCLEISRQDSKLEVDDYKVAWVDVLNDSDVIKR